MDFGLITGSSLCLLESFASLLLLQAVRAALVQFAARLGCKAGGTGSELGLRLFPLSWGRGRVGL